MRFINCLNILDFSPPPHPLHITWNMNEISVIRGSFTGILERWPKKVFKNLKSEYFSTKLQLVLYIDHPRERGERRGLQFVPIGLCVIRILVYGIEIFMQIQMIKSDYEKFNGTLQWRLMFDDFYSKHLFLHWPPPPD